ncbi:MAG: S-layer homology domain-containing protein [Oscillospiraceae bacterium]|nr:S-layer homology domain-containing protein [Oscillospiraceae bacterium]
MDISIRLSTLLLALLLAVGFAPRPHPGDWVPSPEPPAWATGPDFNPGALLQDVRPSDWFYDYVRLGVRHGFVRGGDGRFEPHRPITRAEVVTMLARMHAALGGVVLYEWAVELPYVDVSPRAHFVPYLVWATELRIVEGNLEGEFQPDQPVTREELAVILHRYMTAYSVYGHIEDRFYRHGRYQDWQQIASWAYEAAHTLRNYELMTGTARQHGTYTVYYFLPRDRASRAEAAVIFARVFEAVSDHRVAV